MRALDFVAAWVQRLLGWLPDGVANFLWLPAFFAVLVIGIRLALRHGFPYVTKGLRWLAAVVVAVIAVPFMALVLLIVTPFRVVRLTPPGVVFGLDDALVSTSNGILAGMSKSITVAEKLARTHLLIILTLAVAIVWRWDGSHCRSAEPSCLTPVAGWVDQIGAGEPEPTPSPTPTPTPKPTKKK